MGHNESGPVPERLAVLFDDGDLLAVDKPAGLIVHDAPGVSHSILRVLKEWHGIAEATPVHRLDRDASGVLVLARKKATAAAVHSAWSGAEKTYVALCSGVPPQAEGLIDALLLEHQTSRKQRMDSAVAYFLKTRPGETLPPLPRPKTSAVHPAGRSSQTQYRVLERAGTRACLLEVRPQQGRMHQIRVHLRHLGCPLAFDPLYNPAPLDAALAAGLTRVPLHARRLKLPDVPGVCSGVVLEAPLAVDIERAWARVLSLESGVEVV